MMKLNLYVLFFFFASYASNEDILPQLTEISQKHPNVRSFIISKAFYESCLYAENQNTMYQINSLGGIPIELQEKVLMYTQNPYKYIINKAFYKSALEIIKKQWDWVRKTPFVYDQEEDVESQPLFISQMIRKNLKDSMSIFSLHDLFLHTSLWQNYKMGITKTDIFLSEISNHSLTKLSWNFLKNTEDTKKEEIYIIKLSMDFDYEKTLNFASWDDNSRT